MKNRMILLVTILFFAGIVMSSNRMGGLSEVQPMNDKVQHLAEEVRGQIESQEGKSFETFIPESYSSQVVAGTNYFVKIDIGDDEAIHARIFVPLPYTQKSPELVNYQKKSNSDPLEYF